uniref:Delta(3,5)-Delta(2,4)-dienoyl-CoA isomerase, mitochondrial-like n=1 Tax=Phallusia mammillata TaxID=59560 RepID=A0A6F9DAY7_9ASCI|nr:delta(3,5)-Delta(2,4)-dienoyl-CoA isomerase, mitochondrial-like [Phallusia mammillata]
MLRFAVRSLSKAPTTFTNITAAKMSSDTNSYKFESLAVSSPKEHVLHVEFNREKQLNSMTAAMWSDMITCFNQAAKDADVRSIILSGRGRVFTAGLDLMQAAQTLQPAGDKDVARRAFELKQFIELAQNSCTVIEKCPKPVLVAIHGACIGGGMDVITACDIRLCTEDAYFSIKEIDVGLAADMGTLQRMPKIIGNEGLVRELAYTARKMGSAEAKECGLVNKVFSDKDKLMEGAIELASMIASKSPVAVQSTKVNMNYARDHSVAEGLEYMVKIVA